jgi:hypothetical protein
LGDELVAALESRPKEESAYRSVCEALCSLTHYYEDNRTWVVRVITLVGRTPALQAKSHEKRAHWERVLAHALERRLPKARTRSLRAKVIVGAAMAAFGYGVDEWIAANATSAPRPYLERAFSFVDQVSG